MKLSSKAAYSLTLKNYPDILNISDMCAILSVSEKTAYKLLKEGKITSMKVGRTYRIPKVHILAYMKIIDRNHAS